MKITTIGLDLAKNVFQLHGVDEHGKTVLKKQVKRDQLVSFFIKLEPCLVGMEACGSAHHWARKLQELGHRPRLMAPQFVKPYVKTNKNDALDAEAICEAVQRPNMRFVAVKTLQQQAILALHRARQSMVKQRTAQCNQLRGLLSEFGIVVPQGLRNVFAKVPALLDDETLPQPARSLMQELMQHLRLLDQRAGQMEAEIVRWHRQTPASKKLEDMPGIGALTASALVASIGEAKNFDSGRQVASWLGLVPRQHSSGGKQVLLGISKRGDVYCRTLLIHGARSVIAAVLKKPQPEPRWAWLIELVKRRGKNIAAVALANKNARIAWALLTRDTQFRADYAKA